MMKCSKTPKKKDEENEAKPKKEQKDKTEALNEKMSSVKRPLQAFAKEEHMGIEVF